MNVSDLVPTGPLPVKGRDAEPQPEQGARKEKLPAAPDFAAMLDTGTAVQASPTADSLPAPPTPTLAAARDPARAQEAPPERADDAEADPTGQLTVQEEPAPPTDASTIAGAAATDQHPPPPEPEIEIAVEPLPAETLAVAAVAPEPAAALPSPSEGSSTSDPTVRFAGPAQKSPSLYATWPSDDTAAPQHDEAAAPAPDMIRRPSNAARQENMPAAAPELRPTASVDAATPAPAGAESVAVAAGGGADWRLAPDAPRPQQPTAVHAPHFMPAVTPQALAQQIAVAVGWAKDRSVEIRLDPPELGRVQIHLRPTDGGLHALVVAERPETHDLLRRHAETLHRDLGAAGFRDISLDFTAGGQAAPGRDEARFATAASLPPDAADPAEATQPAAPRRQVVAGELDIRL